MLAAIIANLQNVQPQPSRLSTIKIDRGGAGPSWPGYDIVDIMGALNSFRERPGEHPVARAARRHAHVGEHLDALKQTREKREAAAFLAGAMLATVESAERFEAMQKLQVSELVAIIDSVRMPPTPPPAEPIAYERGTHHSETGGGIGPALFLGGIVIGLLLARR